MGIEINRSSFEPQDYAAFGARLEENLQSLHELLADPEFGRGPASLGAELEMYIVDANGNPLGINRELLQRADDPLLTLELNRYNLEYNLSPCAVDAGAFYATEQQILERLAHLGETARTLGGRIVPIGILPTLRKSDFGQRCITPRRRYEALLQQLLRRREGPFVIDINGPDPLRMTMDDITLEGANTSFQVHYRVEPRAFADTFNAIQLVTPLVLAIGANSPTLFGHRLWQETRIPLFKQCLDTRQVDHYNWNDAARVSFGQGWVRRGAQELFEELVRIYPALLPVCADASAQQRAAPPALAELRLHQSTVWMWNRPVYDDAAGGMLRVEMRSLPAGPTAVDMVANAAFHIGLAEGLRTQINSLLPALPFPLAERNFYRAAQHGLDAVLVWPQLGRAGYSEFPVSALIERLLPVAREGLFAIGVSTTEVSRYLGVIEQRLQRRRSGAVWQRQKLARLAATMPRGEALHAMLEQFMVHSADNLPVAEWPL